MAMATRQQNKKRKARNALQRERTVKTLTDAPTSKTTPSMVTAAAATGVEGGGGALILAPTLSASNSNAMAGYPPPFMPSSYPFGFVHSSMPALNGQQAMPVIQPQINPQYYAQFPQQPIPSAPYLPPGKSDLEILQKLKEMILHNQHELYKPIPQPLHLASLYFGPPLAQSAQQADTSPATSSSSHQAQAAAEHSTTAIDTDVQMSDIKPEPSPVTIKTSDSSELAPHSALAPAQEAQLVSSASVPQQQQQQSPVIERSRGPSSVQAREKWEAAKASAAAAQAAAAAAATTTTIPASVDATPVSSTSVTSPAPAPASMTTSQVSQPASSTGLPNNNLPPKPETVMERKTSFSSSLPAPPSQPPLLRGSSYRPENSYRPGENSYRPGDVEDRDRRDRDYDRRFDRPRITDHRRPTSITPNDRHYEPPRYDRYEPGVIDRDRSRPPPPVHDERDRARASVSDEKQEDMRSSVPPATAPPVAMDENESVKVESIDNKVPPSPLPPATPSRDNDQPAVTATADVAAPALESASPSYPEPQPSVVQFTVVQPAPPPSASENNHHPVQGQSITIASSSSPAVAAVTAPASTAATDVSSLTPEQPQPTPPSPSNQETHERSLHDRLSTPVSRPLEERISSASPIADVPHFVTASSPSATTTTAAPPAADGYLQTPSVQQQPTQPQQEEQQQQPPQITPATAVPAPAPNQAQPVTAPVPASTPTSTTGSTDGRPQQPYPQPQPQNQPSHPEIVDTRFIPNQTHLAATIAAAPRTPAVYEGTKNTTNSSSNNTAQTPLPPSRTATLTPWDDMRPMLEPAPLASVSARGSFGKQQGYSTPPPGAGAGANGSANGYDYRDRRATPTGGRYSNNSYHGNNNNNHQQHQQQRGSYTREFQPAAAVGMSDHHRARSGPPSSGPGYYGSSTAAAAAQGSSGGARGGAYETDADRRYMPTSTSSPAQHGHAHQHHGGNDSHVDERRDWQPRDGWSSSPAPAAAMAGHEQDYWHGGGGGGSGGSGRERYERNDAAKDRVRSNTWDESHHGHGHVQRGSYGSRHSSLLPLTHPQSEVAQRALLARLGDIPPAPGPNPIVIDDRYSSRTERYPPPPAPPHPPASSSMIVDDVYGGRIRARSPSPLRRGGVDDVRPPLKRARDDYGGVASIPPPHSTGSGSVPGGYYDPRDPAPRALPPSASLGVISGSRGEYPPPPQRAHTQTPPGGAGYYDRSAVYERDYYGVPPPPLSSSASAYDRGRYARDPRYDLPPPPRTG